MKIMYVLTESTMVYDSINVTMAVRTCSIVLIIAGFVPLAIDSLAIIETKTAKNISLKKLNCSAPK